MIVEKAVALGHANEITVASDLRTHDVLGGGCPIPEKFCRGFLIHDDAYITWRCRPCSGRNADWPSGGICHDRGRRRTIAAGINGSHVKRVALGALQSVGEIADSTRGGRHR